ncbi:MAG: T9SS type A sorting domain-containing protein [Candidatus Kapabacteria bacterium]|nr:T9SS type A sorting domain-containing protein [Candidatus Kapabacteria bacterium]
MSLKTFFMTFATIFAMNIDLMLGDNLITFEAINEKSGAVIYLDSIVVLNKTTMKSTTLIGENSFDPFSSTSVDRGSNGQSQIINNQFDGKLIINEEFADSRISVYSSTGQLVYSSVANIRVTEIDTERFPFGLYLIQAVSSNIILNEKFIKGNNQSHISAFPKFIFLAADLFDFYAYRRGFLPDTIADVEPVAGTKYLFSMFLDAPIFYDSIRFEISGLNVKGSVSHEWSTNGTQNNNYYTESNAYSANFLTIRADLGSIDESCVKAIYSHLEKPPKFVCSEYHYDAPDSTYLCHLSCSAGSWTSTIYSSKALIFFDFTKSEISQIMLDNIQGKNEQSGTQPPYNRSINQLSIILSHLPFTETDDMIYVEMTGSDINKHINGFNAKTYSAATYMSPPYDYQHYSRDYFKIEEVLSTAKLKIIIYKKQ